MALFVTSTTQATLHGVYAIERQPPSVINAAGTGTVAIVEQFPWGPDGIVNTISDMTTFVNTYAPAGMSRTGAGYMAVMGKNWPTLKVVRVLGPTAAAATCTINKTGPTAFIVITLKYKGTAGNSVTATTTAATDGDPNHFNLLVSVTNGVGTTTDKFENLNYSGTGADSAPSFTGCFLVGNITKSSAGVPIIGTSSFTGGVDGSVTSAEYVGTQGTADKGIALFESDKSIDIVITGDPGNSLRAAVNAGLTSHAAFMTDRMAFISGNTGLTGANVRTDVVNYRNLNTAYFDVWAYQKDDTDGTERLVSPAAFAASVSASLSPSTSLAWKNSVVKSLLRNVSRLETARGADAYQNTLAGVCTLQQELNGGFTFESAVNTNAPVTPSKKSIKRTRMGIFIAKSVTGSIRESVDAPNVPLIQQDEVNAVTEFLDGLKRNMTVDPINQPHIADYAMPDLATFNTAASLANGDFTIPANVQISSDQERIFFSINYGETVNVNLGL